MSGLTVTLPPEAAAALAEALLPALRECVRECVAEHMAIEDLTPRQAAQMLGKSTRTLATWRAEGRGPAYSGGGQGRSVRYKRSDVLAYLESERTKRGGEA